MDYPAVLVETWAVVFLPVIPHLLVWAIEQAALVTKDRLGLVEKNPIAIQMVHIDQVVVWQEWVAEVLWEVVVPHGKARGHPVLAVVVEENPIALQMEHINPVVAVVWTYPVVVELHRFPVEEVGATGLRHSAVDWAVEEVLREELRTLPHQLIRHQR